METKAGEVRIAEAEGGGSKAGSRKKVRREGKGEEKIKKDRKVKA